MSHAETQQTLPQVTTVTKSPGRVEAGKRLAEWNRQKRLSKQAKQNILSGEPEKQTQHVQQTLIDAPKNDTTKPNTWPYMLYAITAICGGYTAYRVWNSKQQTKQKPSLMQQPKPQPEPQPMQNKQPDNDPFEMY